jgi:hypothetical protein
MSTRASSATAFALYCAATALLVHPFIGGAALSTATFGGDARLLVWTMAWDAHALLNGLPFFDANIYHPQPGALAWAEHHVGVALFALPAQVLTQNPVLAYWSVWLASFPLNALAMRALARRVTGDEVASFVAGLVYAFCFFRMHHAVGHVQLLWTWALPLVPLALERWLDKPLVSRTLALTLLVLIQVLTTWYTAVLTVLLALFVSLFLWPRATLTRRHVGSGAIAALVAAGVVAWLARPYFALVLPPPGEIASNSADLLAYLMPPLNTWQGRWLSATMTVSLGEIWGERTLYAGGATLVLSVVGVFALARREPLPGTGLLGAVLFTGAVAMALSFGPSSSGWAPFDLLASLPGMSLMRAPARFALLVMLALALLAAVGARSLRRRGAIGGTAIAVLSVAIVLESYVVDLPGGAAAPLPTPAVYSALATLPAGALVSLPIYWRAPDAFRDADYLLFSTTHWRPMVNGYGRQVPPTHEALYDALATFPSAEAVSAMRTNRVRYVIVHTNRARELRERVEQARQGSAFHLIRAFEDGDALFELK